MNQQTTTIPASVLTATLGAAATLRPAQAMALNLRESPRIQASYLLVVANELERMDALLNSPELLNFPVAVQLEAAHQRERFDTDHDAGKSPEDWFWLIAYLSGRALAHHKEAERLQAEINDDTTPAVRAAFESVVKHHREKAVHHTITCAAACANWHAAVLGLTNMRPGYDLPKAVQPHAAETNPLENTPCPK